MVTPAEVMNRLREMRRESMPFRWFSRRVAGLGAAAAMVHSRRWLSESFKEKWVDLSVTAEDHDRAGFAWTAGGLGASQE